MDKNVIWDKKNINSLNNSREPALVAWEAVLTLLGTCLGGWLARETKQKKEKEEYLQEMEMNEAQIKPYEEIGKKEKEEYLQEMEVYKQKKEEEAASLQLEEEEHIKIQKQEALQLLKKKEKSENLIKKTKATRQKKKQQKGEQKKDPNKLERPMSSFLLFSQETRKNLVQERPELDNSQLIALISVK